MTSIIRFGSGVLKRYANLQPKPRGYPEVPALYGNIDVSRYIESAQRSNAALIPRPVVLCVRVPDNAGSSDACVERLAGEIELVAPLFDDDRDVVRLSFSGAPDRLRPATLARLLATIADHFRLVNGARFDCLIEQVETQADVARIAASRAAGARKTDVAMTFGLARQAPDAFAAVMQALVDAHPASIHLRDGALTEAASQSPIVAAAATRLSMLELAVNQLISGGYYHAGKGTFAQPKEKKRMSRNDLIGIGPGAMSGFGDGVFENAANAREWQEMICARRLPVARAYCLGKQDRLRADVLRQLLYMGHVDISSIEQRFAIRFDVEFAAELVELGQLEALELVSSAGDRIVATSHGRILWHIIAACFDPDSRPPRRTAQRNECDVEESQRGDTTQ